MVAEKWSGPAKGGPRVVPVTELSTVIADGLPYAVSADIATPRTDWCEALPTSIILDPHATGTPVAPGLT
jgi:hypothetical protein